MDDYPAHSLDHSIPFLVALGLPSSSAQEWTLDADLHEQAIPLSSELPPLEGEDALALSRYLKEVDASGLPWSARDATENYKFRVRNAGRTFLLPPRRARLPENFEIPQSPPPLHSPFSPLSPSCHLYPDGIIDPHWLEKHQALVPSIFLCCYRLTSDPTLATLEDNKIKSDINALKSALLRSGYKSRIAVVVLADSSSSVVEGAQERLENIRRGCGLDPKALFLLPPEPSEEELERITDNALATLYGQAVEYYRDLGRHARKKRGRGYAPQPSVPPTSGTSQTLSLSGWNVRYDFKSAVFAEFRQEMEVALRSFEQAYEVLLGADVLDAIPSWSPRWNEARLLADIIAIRGLRCLLWNGQTSTAVRRWQAHRDRICDLVDRRGRGTNNYGWKAWEARWTLVMTNLIEKVGIPELAPETGTLFLQPEKGVIGERLPPWELLHHVGYWYRAAARHLYARRALAYAIPEDDRRPPDSSPASKVASRAFAYDNYMCPDPHEEYPLAGKGPGFNHSRMIIDCLMAARAEFLKRKQIRFAAEISLECGKELAAARNWQGAFDMLMPLWESIPFTTEGWWNIAEDLLWVLRAAASGIGRGDLVVGIDWELLDRRYTRRQNWPYDITRALDGMPTDGKPSVIKSKTAVPSFLSISFAFRSSEGKAGEVCLAQLAITSNAFPGSVPIVLSTLRIQFQGSIKPVELFHDPSLAGPSGRQPGSVLSFVSLQEQSSDEEGPPHLKGGADLTLRPQATAVFEMAIPLREPGDAQAYTAQLALDCETFSLQQDVEFTDAEAGRVWYLSPTSRKSVSRTNSHSIHILPRPPKIEIKFLGLLNQYYSNEPIDFQFEILNAEDADANVKLDALMFGEEPPGFKLFIGGEEIDTAPASEEESVLLSVPLGVIPTANSIKGAISIGAVSLSTTYDVTLRASYNLVTDPATPIVQTREFKLELVNPFEANYELLPRLHADPWPSLFDYEGALPTLADEEEEEAAAAVYQSQPRGLSQAWTLVTRYASFASEDLRVTDLDIEIKPVTGVSCRATRRSALVAEGLRIEPKTIESAEFEVAAQKVSLDDRSPVSLDVSFIIKWQRLAAPPLGDKDETTINTSPNTTILPVPRLGIFGTEPRVLATVSYSPAPPSLVFLTVWIENASNHFLTFGLTMEPSDEFAFSGAKQTTLNLLPVSRRAVTYRLLPLARGTWVRPGLLVRDKYFQKVLRVMPTDGMRLEKEGFSVWVPPLEEEEEEEEGEGGEEGGEEEKGGESKA